MMPATNPEQICHLFRQYMAEGNLEALLSLYDPEVAFLNQAGEIKRGRQGLKGELAPLASSKATFDFDIKQIIQSGDIALMHTHWTISASQPKPQHAIEVARRQPDGSWCWLIGDPFTVGKHASA
jgi:ketosteroid isomerase-like protein